jgi:hypothetical protein
MRAVMLALAVALLAAACSGGDDGEETQGQAGTTVTESQPSPPPAPDAGTSAAEPGRILLAFVRAAGRGDADAMWRLLSEPTRASIGPTLQDFRAGAAQELEAGLGSLAPKAKVILSRSLRDDWAVAAVAGDREVEGGEPEYYAYGAALLPENGALKLELGGVVITGYKPEPLAVVDDRRPTIAANVGAGGDLQDVRMWLDGKPFPAERGANDTPFTATLRGRPAKPLAAGRHEVVVFAATTETATATAWAFTVK